MDGNCCRNGRAANRDKEERVNVVIPYSGKTIMSTPCKIKSKAKFQYFIKT
jgi:hypothetical protein